IIARECLFQAGITDRSHIKRFWVSEALTEEVIRKGIKNANPLADYDKIAEQGFARQHADWLTGMNFCRYITQMANRKFVVGRVQTAILCAIEERCNEIKNFKSEKYFEHYGIFRPAHESSASCRGIYFKANETRFLDNTRDIKLKAHIGAKAKLIDSTIEKKISNPPQLYNLNALQKDAYKFFGYSADKTLKIAQSLYEELKCISYPRTPSCVMGSSNVELCNRIADSFCTKKPFIRKVIRPQMDISLSNKRCFNDKKLEAHHALIPLKSLPENASEDQEHIYKLIFYRFLTAFLPPCEYEKQIFVLDVNENKFRITGKKILKRGWKELNTGLNAPHLEEDAKSDNKNDSGDEQLLENIDWNNLVIGDVETKEKWTKPPAFFNEASILSFMENPKAERHELTEGIVPNKKLVGLGTAATRHTFIPKLMKYGYVELQNKNIVVTELGTALLKAVRSSLLKSLADISATTEWEEKLDENPSQFSNDIKVFVKKAVSQNIKIDIPFSPKNIISCPLCKKEIRKGKANWFCIGYKDGCTFKIWESVADAKITEDDVIALCNGRQTKVKHCTSKDGKPFKCKFGLNDKKEIKFIWNWQRRNERPWSTT
ncbi:MAG: hypothetical protein IJP90_06965, partial [Treponema sp.]|nr:hypothetical protein [Treponema sp.]